MLKTIAKALLALLLLCSIVLFAWYRVDGIPTPEAASYLQGEGYSSNKTADGSLLFSPEQPNNKGLVIMHGALIKPASYTRSAAFFAGRGYTVYLPYGPGRLSVTLAADMPARMAAMNMDEWYFIGHSMGGLAALETIAQSGTQGLHLNIKKVALWAAAMPKDFSHLTVPILFIWGDSDGLLPEERFAAGKPNLPDTVEYLTLPGANHKNFALYSHQFFDSDATIDWLQQIDFANSTTANFFATP
jgi:pimeloyl-ACP methyl ester carboxylesterase